jgi:hypothetical protein
MTAHEVRRAAPLVAALIAAPLLLLAAPALAHPFVVGGGRVPVQSLATITLDLAHGCGVEGAGTGPDTDEVALEVPAWLRIVDVPEPDGWRVTIEDATDVRPGAVVWTATTATEPAPRFPLDVVVDGEAGETRHLRVSQRCGGLVERWIGTPDAPAAQPAVRLRLEPPDPERPAPPLPEPEAEPAAEPEPEPEVDPEAEAALTPEAAAGTGEPDSAVREEPTGARGGSWSVAVAALGGALATWAAVTARRRCRTGSGTRD